MKNKSPIHDNWETPECIKQLIRDEYGDYFDPCPLYSAFDGLAIEWHLSPGMDIS